MKSIVYQSPDGSVCIVHPAPNAKFEKESEEDFLTRIVKKDVPQDAINVRLVEKSDIPTDRTFRNAWTPSLSVDMGKARELHKNKLRSLRQPLLDKLDVEFMKAVESGDQARQAEIAAKKKALRDVTADPAIDGAKNPEELKAVMPAALKA